MRASWVDRPGELLRVQRQCERARARQQAVQVVAEGQGRPVDRLRGHPEVVVETEGQHAGDRTAPGHAGAEEAVVGVLKDLAAGAVDDVSCPVLVLYPSVTVPCG